MKWKLLLPLLVLGLAACGGKAAAPATAIPTTPVPPTEPLTPTSAASQPDCTVVSFLPTPGPTERSAFPPPAESDWSLGPKDATVTIIEYSDFQ